MFQSDADDRAILRHAFPGAQIKRDVTPAPVVDIQFHRSIGFRGAVLRFSEEIRNATWEPEFPADAENIYVKEIAPEVANIEAAVKENHYLRKLVDKAITGGLAAMIGRWADAPDVLAIGLGAAATNWHAYQSWRKENELNKQNQLYFYYQTKKRLT